MHEETTDASQMLEIMKLTAYIFLELECNTVSITTFLHNAVYYEINTRIFDGWVRVYSKMHNVYHMHTHMHTYANACALPFNDERNILVFCGWAGVY